MNTVLVVDDEQSIRELIQMTLERMGIRVLLAANVSSAKKMIATELFDFCLTDMRLPDGDGIELLHYIHQQFPDIPVAVLTAHGNVEMAVNALKSGAFDFVSKPVDITVLRNLVKTGIQLSNVKPDPTLLHHEKLSAFLGQSSQMQLLRMNIKKLACSQAPVFISGASGVGKELVARTIHEEGPRRSAAFVPVNCGAIPSELMESEFFGHKKGSFTGAVNDKEGLFQAAQGGTLFLDEIADLPLLMQVKLLRAIQEKSVRPIGSQKEIAVDVRILSATHQNLRQLVQANQFRQDLFYRINVIELPVPTLAERKEDIPELASHILFQLGGSQAPTLSKSAMTALMAYAFPGNIRELENILERAYTLCESRVITPELLQFQPAVLSLSDKKEGGPLPVLLDDIERERIEAVLMSVHWNKKAAAAVLGLSLRALRYRLKKLGIDS